jgi:predicted nucleic acid-binding protein
MESGTLVDTNVWLDVLNEDADWLEWSGSQLADAIERGPVLINQLIYAELLTRIDEPTGLDAFLGEFNVRRMNLPWEAAWLTSRAYVRYRRRGGTRTSPLPDSCIGSHAAVSGLSLLTRDARRYREYFKDIDIIAPSR